MDLINSLRGLAIVLALIVIFWILVVYGVKAAPMWLIYASYPIAAIGGGAAISLILERR